MSDDNLLPFSFPAVQRKKITAAFDGGGITSDGGSGQNIRPGVPCGKAGGIFRHGATRTHGASPGLKGMQRCVR
jgi:hypothetical protein